MYCALEWKLQENSSVGDVLEYSGVGYVLIRTIKRLGCARIFKYTVYIHWVDILGLGVEVVRYSPHRTWETTKSERPLSSCKKGMETPPLQNKNKAGVMDQMPGLRRKGL
jgi:hypothetical protein